MSQLVCRVEGSSLTDGAERMDSLIRGVKDRQYSDALNAPAPKSVSSAYAVSPEEAWSKKFMTAGIGPGDFKPAQMPALPIVPPGLTLKPLPKALEPVLAPSGAGALRPGHIGAVLAKPAGRRSWFGRLVRGN